MELRKNELKTQMENSSFQYYLALGPGSIVDSKKPDLADGRALGGGIISWKMLY